MAEDILAVERLQRLAVERNPLINPQCALLLDRLCQPRSPDVISIACLQRNVIEGRVEADSEVRR